MLKILNISVIFLFIVSCAGEVIKRNHQGRMPRTSPRKFFTGVKKKVVLLEFHNESPYGGLDLGITATEEIRNELNRTG